MGTLEPLSPREAVRLYLDHREPEVSEKTLQNQRYRLSNFVDWAEETTLDNLNSLTGRHLHQYRTHRSQSIKKVTLVNELRTLQKFLEFAATIDAVEEGMRERVLIPDISKEEEARDDELDDERAKAILEYLERFRYASRDHVILALLWHAGIRLGTLRAIDVDDFDAAARCIDIRHRPETGTPLKNGLAAERSVAVSEHYCQVIEDFLEYHRIEATDDHGREPLITSEQGRLSIGAVRATVYRLTQPCVVQECPHDKDPKTCEYRDYDRVSQCPSSVSPHAVRRGSITAHLRRGAPQRVVEDRANVSDEVLEQHYDERTDREKMEARRDWVERVGGYDSSPKK